MKVLMVGCGNMGGAMLARWVEDARNAFTVVKPSPGGLPEGVTWHAAPDALGEARFDVIVLAVKPQMMAEVAPLYAEYLAEGGVVISIAAGVSLATLGRSFPGAAIVRVMPNLPARIGAGMSGLVANDLADARRRGRAEALAARTGDILWVDSEDALDRLTAVSGSGPGYVFHLIEAYIAAAQSLGFSDDEARRLVFATLAGTVEMARASDRSPTELRASVTSRNGTTQAGLEKLMAGDAIAERLTETVGAAYARARELSAAS